MTTSVQLDRLIFRLIDMFVARRIVRHFVKKDIHLRPRGHTTSALPLVNRLCVQNKLRRLHNAHTTPTRINPERMFREGIGP